MPEMVPYGPNHQLDVITRTEEISLGRLIVTNSAMPTLRNRNSEAHITLEQGRGSYKKRQHHLLLDATDNCAVIPADAYHRFMAVSPVGMTILLQHHPPYDPDDMYVYQMPETAPTGRFL